MLVGGSKVRIKLHNEIEMLGGCSTFETVPEFTYCAVNIFPEKMAGASKILSSLLFDSSFDDEKLEIERKVILNEIADFSDDPRSKIDETLAKCLFKSHPIRRPISGTKQSVRQVTLDQIEEAHHSRYAPQNMIMMLTGAFSDEDVEKVLENFQDRENQDVILKESHEIEKSKPKKEAKIEKPGMIQAYLTLGG
jgi:predicted Zn-dependent peptidase